MAKDKPPKRLFRSADRVSSFGHDRSPVKRMKQVARDHEDVLQNIEFVLVEGHRGDPRVDDRDARAALLACLHGAEPDGPRPAQLAASLAAVRGLRTDITDATWHDALRVVEESVRRHSQFRPGETSYLAFAARFLP